MKIINQFISFILLCTVIFSCDLRKDEIKLHILNGGSIEVGNAKVLGIAPIKTTLQNRVYLIEHPKGIVLWDTGLPDHYADSINGVVTPLSVEKVNIKLADQIESLGISREDIDYLVLSHTHSDHAGNLDLFPSSELIIQESEYNLAISDSAHKSFIHSEPIKALKKVRTIPNRDLDLFGDGTIILKFSPGHTVGHQSLFVRLSEYGNILISGDLYHHPMNRAFGLFPIFNFNHEMTYQSSESIESFIKKQNAELWIQHAPLDSDSLKYSPFVYR